MSEGTPSGAQGIRAAAMLRNAIKQREETMAPAVAAFDRAETTEERASAAADLLSASWVADEAYRQGTAQALARMVEKPSPMGQQLDPKERAKAA